MFLIMVEGGPFDGKLVDKNGEVSSGVAAPLEIEELADAQDWIERNQDKNDFGPGATLVIDEA
jgi:hypothetical protein